MSRPMEVHLIPEKSPRAPRDAGPTAVVTK